jgi:hypothetical protein
MKTIFCFLAFSFTLAIATAYCVDDANESSEVQVGANSPVTDSNAPVVDSNPGTGQIFSFVARKPDADWRPLSGGERFQHFLKSTYGLESSLFIFSAAGIAQANDTVPEWGQGMEGFGKRLASGYGRRAVRQSIQLSLGAMLHEDPRYLSSNQSGIWKRTLYATCRAFVAQKNNGGIRPGYTQFIGAFSSAYISRQWHPESDHTLEDYLSAGAVAIGFDVVRNVYREYWPDLKKMFRK